MQSFLEFERAELRRYFPNRGRWLDILASDGPEQEIIQDWCKKTRIPKRFPSQSTLADLLNSQKRPANVSPCEEWEARLICLSDWFSDFRELNEWEAAPAEERMKQALRVAKLARQLASALEESPRPYYPPALELFEEERAVDIIRALPEPTARALLRCTGYAHDWHPRQGWHTQYQRADRDSTYYRANPASNLAMRFDSREPQGLPSMLRRLADLAEQRIREPKRDDRPKTGNPNARIFARHLAEDFKRQFDRTPNDVIAACVCLRFPDLEEPPNEDTIRAWRGAR